MRFPLFLLFISFGILFCCSCGERTCTQGDIYFQPKGYDSSELSNVIVKKYPKGSGFSTSSDVSSKALRPSEKIQASAAYDWVVELPLAGKSYAIRDIRYKNDKDGEKSLIRMGERDACTDGINYIVDDRPAEILTSWGNSGSPIIILKR